MKRHDSTYNNLFLSWPIIEDRKKADLETSTPYLPHFVYILVMTLQSIIQRITIVTQAREK